MSGFIFLVAGWILYITAMFFMGTIAAVILFELALGCFVTSIAKNPRGRFWLRMLWRAFTGRV